MDGIFLFNRHENMSVDTLSNVSNVINKVIHLNIDDKFKILNYLYGLYDGYYYKAKLKHFQDSIKQDHAEVHSDLESVLNEVETYNFSAIEI